MPTETISEAYEMVRKAMETHDFELMIFACGMIHGENIKLRAELKANRLVYMEPTKKEGK